MEATFRLSTKCKILDPTLLLLRHLPSFCNLNVLVKQAMSFAKFVPHYSLCQSLARTQALCAAAAGQSFVKSVAKTVEASHPELSTYFAPRQSVNELHPFGHLGAPIQSSQAIDCARAAECSCRCHSLLNRALPRATSKLPPPSRRCHQTTQPKAHEVKCSQ